MWTALSHESTALQIVRNKRQRLIDRNKTEISLTSHEHNPPGSTARSPILLIYQSKNQSRSAYDVFYGARYYESEKKKKKTQVLGSQCALIHDFRHDELCTQKSQQKFDSASAVLVVTSVGLISPLFLI